MWLGDGSGSFMNGEENGTWGDGGGQEPSTPRSWADSLMAEGDEFIK